jgi:hypothetical protein
MIENPIIEFVVVISVFIGILLSLTILALIVIKLRLYNVTGLLIASGGTGLIFGTGSLALIMLSKKFSSWAFEDKFRYAGEIFLFTFLLALVLISITFRKNKN